MNKFLKIVWIISLVVVICSMLYFLLGTTACFQRGLGLVTTVIFMCVWPPALAYITLSILVIKFVRIPNKIFLQIPLLVGLLLISYCFTNTFIENSTPYGWLIDIVIDEYMQTTDDGKYEYRLEVVNQYQTNAYVRLYLKDVANGEEMTIKTDIPEEGISGITGVEWRNTSDIDGFIPLSTLTSTDKENIYILQTTEEFDLWKTYDFQVDMENKNMKRLFTTKYKRPSDP